jgi:hypothetical protein
MEKLIRPLVEAVDSFMPGYKTYCIMFVGRGMAVCSMFGHHTFMPETWAMVGMSGGVTWKMGADRSVKVVEVVEVLED